MKILTSSYFLPLFSLLFASSLHQDAVVGFINSLLQFSLLILLDLHVMYLTVGDELSTKHDAALYHCILSRCINSRVPTLKDRMFAAERKQVEGRETDHIESMAGLYKNLSIRFQRSPI